MRQASSSKCSTIFAGIFSLPRPDANLCCMRWSENISADLASFFRTRGHLKRCAAILAAIMVITGCQESRTVVAPTIISGCVLALSDAKPIANATVRIAVDQQIPIGTTAPHVAAQRNPLSFYDTKTDEFGRYRIEITPDVTAGVMVLGLSHASATATCVELVAGEHGHHIGQTGLPNPYGRRDSKCPVSQAPAPAEFLARLPATYGIHGRAHGYRSGHPAASYRDAIGNAFPQL